MFKVFVALSLAGVAVLAFALSANAGGGGGGCHEGLTDAPTSEVVIDSSCFTPTIVRLQTGGTVTWKNADEMPHSVLGAGGAWGSSRQNEIFLQPGQAFSHTFEVGGIFPYYCSVHPGMIGVVSVGESQSSIPSEGEAPGVATGLGSSDGRVSSRNSAIAIAGVGAAVVLVLASGGIVRARYAKKVGD
jgi:plastocyanin